MLKEKPEARHLPDLMILNDGRKGKTSDDWLWHMMCSERFHI